MGASRTRRFVGGVSVGYLYSAVATLAGLWLTPYLLGRLEEHDYGLWLLMTQLIFFLALSDLGVVALVPRDVARKTGQSAETGADGVRQLVGETARIVWWQLPIVAIAGAATWWLVADAWPSLRGPLAVVVTTVVLTFPFRILPAVLQGVQDLTFLGGVQIAAWIAGTLVTIVLIERGVGLYALAAGWACTQAIVAGLAWVRLTRRFPDVLPQKLPAVSLASGFAQLRRSLWICVAQVAQILVNGTDLLLIGALLGPEVVVPYACTGKLVTLLASQPQLLMATAVPAMSEIGASGTRAHLFQVSTSLTQLLLILSGAVACVVLVVNGPFVSWWVGPDRFAGLGLTGLMVVTMLLRHWNAAAAYTLVCLGHERRVSITTVVDGLVSVTVTAALLPWLGISGAPIGSITGLAVVSLPGNLRALAREEGVPLVAAIRPLRPWFGRFALVAGAVLLAIAWWPDQRLLGRALFGSLVAFLYVMLMLPVALKPPLGSMLAPRLLPWLVLIPGLSRRLASQSMP